MKKKLIVALCLTTLSGAALAQVVGGNASKAMDMNAVPYGTISTFNLAEKITSGSSYLYETWQNGTVQVESGVIPNCPLNIDVQTQSVEINTDKGIRVIPARMIKKVTVGFEGVKSQVFVNAMSVAGAKVHISGLVQILNDDEIKFIRYNYLVKKEGTYNAALDMGDDETKLVIKTRFFLFEKGNIVEVNPNKKKFLNLFPEDKRAKVVTFMKEKDVSLKEQADLAALADFLNQEDIHLETL
jgi:hypothetical protein